MAKKNENNSSSLVLVDAELLSQGLKTAFTGIAMVFDSLGASGAAGGAEDPPQVVPVARAVWMAHAFTCFIRRSSKRRYAMNLARTGWG